MNVLPALEELSIHSLIKMNVTSDIGINAPFNAPPTKPVLKALQLISAKINIKPTCPRNSNQQ